MTPKENPETAATVSGLTVTHYQQNTQLGAEAQPLPFTLNCTKCEDSGWITVGEEDAYVDTGDGRPGGYLIGKAPVEEPCECRVPSIEQLDEETDTEGGW